MRGLQRRRGEGLASPEIRDLRVADDLALSARQPLVLFRLALVLQNLRRCCGSDK